MTTRVVVAGAIAHSPVNGSGYVWAFLQYVLGFRQLGCEVLYVEHLDAADCIDADWRPAPFASSANAAVLAGVSARHDFRQHTALLLRDGSEWIGRSPREIEEWAAAADLFVNLSGRFHLRRILEAPRRRVYVDLDPGFTQIWQAQYGADMNLPGHDAYVSVGLNLGRRECPVPTLGLPWRTICPPVVRAEWQPLSGSGSTYTTVADWRGYSPIEWDGVWYGQKAEEFVRFIDLPRRTPCALEICLAIHPDEPDRPRLLEHGWRLSEPRVHAAHTDAYRRYVRGSRGELSVAKNGYVVGRTGWVSDRTVCYLAAGRPAVVQDTGLGAQVPVGEGLLTFATMDDAVAALARVEADYAAHAAAAGALAARYFDSDRVLAELLNMAGV